MSDCYHDPNPLYWLGEGICKTGEGIYNLATDPLGTTHTGLDVAGAVPGIGEPADALNAVLYSIEGDQLNAALSCMALVPFFGWSALGLRHLGGANIVAEWGAEYLYRHGTGPMTAIEHINYRHAFTTGAKDVSRFAQGTSVRDIKRYVNEALADGTLSPDGRALTFDLGDVIGVDRKGRPVTGIKIYIDNGQIRTAFPVRA